MEKESGESQRIRSQLAGLCRRGGLAFLSKSSKPVGASTVNSSSEDSDSEEKNKPKPKSKANSKGKATPNTAAKPKVPQKRKELIEKKSSEGRRRWKTEAAQPTAEPPKQMEAAKASVVVFPELAVTGYTCGDLFSQQALIDAAEAGVRKIIEYTRGKSVTVVTGAPVRFRGRLYNCAIVLKNGNIKGIVPKIWLPDYNEFYEGRWFSSGRDFLSPYTGMTGRFLANGKDTVREGWCAEIRYAGFRCNISPNLIFEIGKTSFGIEICEDMWTPVPPSSYLALAGAQIILNPSASNEVLAKHSYRKNLVCQQSARNVCGYVYCSSGFGESTQDLVFGGASLIYENGSVLAENERFSTSPSITFADIDTERLDTMRQRMNSFASVAPDGTAATAYDRLYSRIPLGNAAETDFGARLYRHIDPHPFVPAGGTS